MSFSLSNLVKKKCCFVLQKIQYLKTYKLLRSDTYMDLGGFVTNFFSWFSRDGVMPTVCFSNRFEDYQGTDQTSLRL